MAGDALGMAHWAGATFEAELRSWVESCLGPVRLERHKLRPWSTVWRVYAESGLFWVKQNCRANVFEARLVAQLGEWVPASFVPVVAHDPDLGLLLTPDQGEVVGFEHGDVDTWCRIVQGWGEVQLALSGRAAALTALGVPTLTPADTEPEVLRRTSMLSELAVGDPRRLADHTVQRILRSMPEVRRAVEEVSGLGLPLTLNHNDLHGDNVFATADGPRFFDLGDSLVTEPMAALLVPLECYADLTTCGPDAPELWRMAEAWIEVWSERAPTSDLRRALPHALRLARLPRHESWWRITPDLEDGDLSGFEAAGAEWLGAIPDPPLLTSAPA